MKPRKVSATIIHTSTGEAQRLHAKEAGDGMVTLWTKNAHLGQYRTERFGDRLGRSWVRALLAGSPFRAEF